MVNDSIQILIRANGSAVIAQSGCACCSGRPHVYTRDLVDGWVDRETPTVWEVLHLRVDEQEERVGQ